jgi:hypothetical protein
VRIEVERSGGFAGLTRRRSIDAGELPPELADAARTLLAATSRDEAPAASTRGADRFQYRLRVSDASGEHELVASEEQLAPELGALARWVIQHGKAPTSG